MKLSNKVVFLTGASSGIGREIASTFAKEGAKIFNADISENDRLGGKRVAELVKENGAEYLYLKTDVSRIEDIENAVSLAVARFEGIDILVNCAGIYHYAGLLDTSEETFDRVMDTNLKGAVFTCKAVAREMIARGRGGRMIMLSSVFGLQGYPDSSAFITASGGQIIFNRGMALEFAPHGINVNAILLGTVRTGFFTGTLEGYKDGEKGIQRPSNIVMKVGEPADIAKIALFLSSEDSNMITGACIAADGGMSAGGI